MKKILALLATVIISVPIFATEVWNGLVHISNPADLEKKPINLSGMWEFYPNQEFQSYNKEQYDTAFIKVPGSWNVQAKKNFRSNFACYRIKIVGLESNAQYAIYSRRCPATASKFFCNGKLIASYGEYSSEEKNSTPANTPVYAFLESDFIGSIELVVQVSCYANYEAGIISPILFARRDVITNKFENILLFITIIVGALLFACIINFAIFIGDHSLKIHLIFGFLLFGILCHSLTVNSNIISWAFPILPYNFIKQLEIISLWISPQLFSLIMMDDKTFSNKVKYLDKILFCIFSTFGIVFLIIPIRYTNYLISTLWVANGIFFAYSIFRMSLAFATNQIKLGIFISFYILIAVGYFFDLLFPEISANSTIIFSQFTILLLEIFDVFFMAYNHQSIFHNTRKAMFELKNVNETYMKFIVNDFLKLINNEHPEKVSRGNYKRKKAIILDAHLMVMYSDGRTLHPRKEFEAYSQFIKSIYDIIQKNNGIISGSVGNGCIAIFDTNPEDVFTCAREMINELRRLNEQNVKLGEASAMISCGIHKGDVIVGVIGEENSFTECILGSGIEVASRIENISLKFGVPVLVSKTVVDELEGNPPCKISLFQRSVITQDEGEVYLYECHNEDYSPFFEDENKVPQPLSYKETEDNAIR